MTPPDTKIDYKYVDDDFRRGLAANNLETTEREHATVVMSIDTLNDLIQSTQNDEMRADYNEQLKKQTLRLESVTAQCLAWRRQLDAVPTIAETVIPSE